MGVSSPVFKKSTHTHTKNNTKPQCVGMTDLLWLRQRTWHA